MPQPFTALAFSVAYEYLCPDNQKYYATSRGGRARLFLSPKYRAAKDTIQHVARQAMRGYAMTALDVELHAKLYVPDARRRDAMNLAKCCQDAIQGVVVADDTQIKRATWEYMGIDRVNPRCEIVITKRTSP